MPTELLLPSVLNPPEGLDEIGVLRELVHRGDVVLVVDGEDVAGFYRANTGERDALKHVPPEFRWSQAAKLGADRLRNRGDSALRELDLDSVLPAHLRQPVELPPLDELLDLEGSD